MNEYLRKGGKERRRHKMYVTRNTEYHLRDDICVGIRKKSSGAWLKRAKALKAKLIGSVKSIHEIATGKGATPQVGESLLFINDEGEDIVTTMLDAIARPPKEAVGNYLPPEKKLDEEASSVVGYPRNMT
jgi:hypothetical protein